MTTDLDTSLLVPTTPRRKPSALLSPLPENTEFSVPISIPVTSPPSSYKDLLIFGPASPDNSSETLPAEEDNAWLTDPQLCRYKSNLHRCSTAPAMAAINDIPHSATHSPLDTSPGFPSIISQAFILLVIYLTLGVAIYAFNTDHFSGNETHPVVDALYFCIVTMCTIGYGDITPNSASAKLFSIAFVLVGFGFVDILLSGMVSYVLDLQESLLLTAVKKRPEDIDSRGSRGGRNCGEKCKGDKQKDGQHHHHHHRHDIARHYIVDVKKGRMRIRMKVALALGVVLLCIGVGTLVLCFVEKLGLLDSFYLAVMSVTTVGYGDRAFKTMAGRLFASIWLLVSTLAVARAFLYLAEARIDKRHRKIAKWVLCRDLTVSEFLAADIDHNGFVTKSEYVIYKLKEMGKVSEKDIMLICNQFDKIDTGKLGKITLSDLIETHHQ